MTTFRDLALAEAGAVEQPHFGSPSFRVNGKIFAQLSSDDEVGLVKLSLGMQEWLLATHSGRCWSDLHWGRHGWTHLGCAEVDAALLKDLISQSWALAARRSEQSKVRQPSDSTALAGEGASPVNVGPCPKRITLG